MKKDSGFMSNTKKDLMDAFWELYCHRKIEKITVKSITEKAGYNRSTFYEYFIDVYDVLEQIENSLIPTVIQLPYSEMLHKDMDLPAESFLKLYEENEKYYSVLLGDKGDPAFASKIKDSIKPMLREMISSEVEVDNVEFDFILEYILSSMINIVSYWFKNNKPLSADKLVNLINNIMENGIVDIIKNKN